MSISPDAGRLGGPAEYEATKLTPVDGAVVEGPDVATDAVAATGASLLVDGLIAAGVTTVFGVPGDTGVAFYDALLQRHSDIRHVLAGDERQAAFMADVYARRTNRIGVVEVSSGGGAAFVIGGLGEPYAASIPMLVISTDIHRSSRGTGALTEADQCALLAGVTKRQIVVESAGDMLGCVRGAIEVALSGIPGPVALSVPENVLDERWTGADGGPSPQGVLRPQPTAAREDAVAEIAAALAAAERPAIFAGSGVHLSAAYPSLLRLAESAAIPVATSIHGKGAISERHPLSLGVAGGNGARPYANEWLADADAVLFVGTRANATDTNSFTTPPRSCPTVGRIDIDSERAASNYPGCVALVGDAGTVLDQICEVISEPVDSARKTERERWIQQRRDQWLDGVDQSPVLADGVLDPGAVVRTLAGLVGPDTTVVGDAGTPTPYLAAMWELQSPGRRVVLPRGHGPMGYAFPGAVGASLADNTSVLALVTDGSLLMAVGALESVVRLNLPIVYVQFTNGSLGWIKTLQHFYFHRRYFGTDIGWFDSVAIAKGFGLRASRALSLADLANAVNEALSDGRPTFIDVVVPVEYDMVPPVSSWQEVLRYGTASRPVY